MRSDRQSVSYIEYVLIIIVCVILGLILYASIQYRPHEIHTSTTSPPHQIIQELKVSNQASSNLLIGNKMSNLKSATMGSKIHSINGIVLNNIKLSKKAVKYVPINLDKAIHYVSIKRLPEGQLPEEQDDN